MYLITLNRPFHLTNLFLSELDIYISTLDESGGGERRGQISASHLNTHWHGITLALKKTETVWVNWSCPFSNIWLPQNVWEQRCKSCLVSDNGQIITDIKNVEMEIVFWLYNSGYIRSKCQWLLESHNTTGYKSDEGAALLVTDFRGMGVFLPVLAAHNSGAHGSYT